MFDRFLIWLDDRTSVPTLAHKIRHWSVPQSGAYARLLPAMVIFTFLLQVITGLVLWTFYSPSAQTAWESLYHLQFNLPGGWLIRGIHYFAAQLMPVLLGLYLLGLIFSGRYRPPREFVFWTAFILFLLALGLSLTGDLLSWSLSGVSATLVRVRFLQMLPFVGEPLFRIVCGGAEFGTLTIPRFLVLHIFVMGGGFFALLVLWRFFDYRAAKLATGSDAIRKPIEKNKGIPLFSNEILKYALASLFITAIVLLLAYRAPILNTVRPDTFPTRGHLPREALLGVHLGAPADTADFYDAARPEWSFRALYHFSQLKIEGDDGTKTDLFPGEQKFIPIFVITGGVVMYVFLIPVIGRLFIGHCFNVLTVSALFGSLCYLTYESYYHDYIDPSMQSFREAESEAERRAERIIELCLAQGIPLTGALTLVQSDPFLQGPVLYKQHCAMCHSFIPEEGEPEYRDFKPIPCEMPKAPNLYQPIRKEWIAGFLDPERIGGVHYFGNTKFASGTMVGFVNNTLPTEIAEAKDLFKVDDALDQLLDFLVSEAEYDVPRASSDVLGAQRELWGYFTCSQCHMTHEENRPAIQAPDLRGYLSRDWLIGMIADPESTRFYGPPVGRDRGNDAMPAHLPKEGEAVLTLQEIELLADWLRGSWHRYQKVSKIEEAMLPIHTQPMEEQTVE